MFAKITLLAKSSIILLPQQTIIIQADEWKPEAGFFVVRNNRFTISARPSPEHIAQMQSEVFQARLFAHASLN